MLNRRRIQVCKWAGALVAVLLLSQGFGRWRAFIQAPTPLTYVGMVLVLTGFLLLMAFLAVVVYAEEKALGRLPRTRPFFDRWSDRFFLQREEPHVR